MQWSKSKNCHNGIICMNNDIQPTSVKIFFSTRNAINPMTYLFLFSRTQLSICSSSRRPSGLSRHSSMRVNRRHIRVRLVSCDHCKKSKYPKFPMPWTRQPVRWVRKHQRFWQDFGMRKRWGRLVLFWSIPSTIIEMNSVGFSIASWRLE